MRWCALFAMCAGAFAQTPPAAADSTAGAVAEVKGIPARAAPSDYQAHAQAGAITIAADFTGHSVSTTEGVLTTEDFVVFEAALFGPADARLALSADDFTVRINGKKPLPSQPYDFVVKTLRDLEWEPSASSGDSKKTNINGSGKDLNAPPPPPPPVPFEMRRAWGQRVRKISLPSGDRPLPQAGLLFFSYGGKTEGLRSIELIYNGPAGKATVSIQP